MTRASCLVVAAMAALCCVLPGASAIAQDQTDYFVTGVEKFQRGEYDQAALDLARAVQAHPNWDAAWYFLGAAQFQTVYQNLAAIADTAGRDYSEAQKSLTKALELAPSRPGVRMLLGRIAEEKQGYDEAKRLYREELSLKQLVGRNSVQMALGRISYRTGLYTDANTVLQRVLVEEPRYVEALYFLGRSQLAQKEYQPAIKSFKLAIKLLNEWLDRIYHLLRLEYLEIDPDDAERASKVVEHWDELRKELWGLRQATARPNKDTLEKVIQDYGRAQEFALELHLWPELNMALGDAYCGIRDWSAARNQYRRAMSPREGEGSENDPDAWGHIGRAYFLGGKELFEQNGLLMSAIEQFKAAEGDQAKPDPDNPQPDPTKLLDGYAKALFVAGINKSAKVDQMKAPVEPDTVIASVFDGLGQLYLYQAETYASDEGRDIKSHTHDESVEAFDKALLYAPTYVPAMLHKAQATLGRGERATKEADKLTDFGKARDLLEQQALTLEPSNADLWAELARSYVGLDELDKAEQAAKKSLLLNKKHLLGLNTAGLVSYYRNQCVAAPENFTEAIEVAPKDFQSYINLGNALYGLRSWARAQAEYVRALNLIPQTSIANTGSQRPYVLYLIARTQHERGLYEQSVSTLGEALNRRTDFYDAQRLLAASYSGLRQWRAAEEALRAALKSAPRDSADKLAGTHAHLGQVYEVQGRLQEAVAEYLIAQAKNPKNIQAADGLRRLAIGDRRPKPPASS